MKKFWNVFLASTLVTSVGITVWLYPQAKMILPIEYDSNLDPQELRLCNKDRIPQYYSAGTYYLGGKRAIKKELLPLINQKKIEFGSTNGYITIRFIVNCNGEIGLFRANEIDSDIKSTKFIDSKIADLKDIVNTLSDWEVKSLNDNRYDSYYFINFKVEEGLITDIF